MTGINLRLIYPSMSACPTRIYDMGRPCTSTSPPLFYVYTGIITDLVLPDSGMICLHRAEVRQSKVTAELASLYSGQIAIDQHLNYSSRTSSVPEEWSHVLLSSNIRPHFQPHRGTASKTCKVSYRRRRIVCCVCNHPARIKSL